MNVLLFNFQNDEEKGLGEIYKKEFESKMSQGSYSSSASYKVFY